MNLAKAFDAAWDAGGSYHEARDRAIAAIALLIRADEREKAAQRVAQADFHPCDECDSARLAVAAARGEDTE